MSGGYAPVRKAGTRKLMLRSSSGKARASFVEKIAICIAASFVEGEFEETAKRFLSL
jgi:hypothetical protein